jgi:23S rRNA (uridine2552-2'-O)-methyltransferase
MRASRGGSLALPAFLGPTHESLFLTSTLPPLWLNPARKLDRSSGLAAFDVVLSDMAPDTTGIRSADQANSANLFGEALTRAERLLAPGGAFVGKLFQGPDFEAIRKRLQARFAEVKVVKPESSRAQSFEIFLGAKGFV